MISDDSALHWWKSLESHECEDVLAWWSNRDLPTPESALTKQVHAGLLAPGDVIEPSETAEEFLNAVTEHGWQDEAIGWAAYRMTPSRSSSVV